MAVETQQIVEEAEKVGQLVAQHPAVARYRDAQSAVTSDPEAGRLLAEFDRQLETLSRQEQSGLPITDAQRMQLESLQSRIVSNLKIKALNLAQVDFVDLLRKVSQAVQRPALEAQGQGQGGPGAVGGGGGGAADRGSSRRRGDKQVGRTHSVFHTHELSDPVRIVGRVSRVPWAADRLPVNGAGRTGRLSPAHGARWRRND